MAYEDFTIIEFERAWFKKDYSKIDEVLFREVYSEYVDTTGAYMGSQFDKIVYIKFLTNRVNTINNFVSAQSGFLEEFGVPYINGFHIIEQYGHSLTWNEDSLDFTNQLKKIIEQEFQTTSDLHIALKELDDLKKQEQSEKQYSDRDKRESWMRSINSLVKIGYTIDKHKMTVEELAYIIKHEKEQFQKDGR